MHVSKNRRKNFANVHHLSFDIGIVYHISFCLKYLSTFFRNIGTEAEPKPAELNRFQCLIIEQAKKFRRYSVFVLGTMSLRMLPPRDLDAADSGAATIDDNNSRHHCRRSFLLVSLLILVFSFVFFIVCVC